MYVLLKRVPVSNGGGGGVYSFQQPTTYSTSHSQLVTLTEQNLYWVDFTEILQAQRIPIELHICHDIF